MPDVRLAFNYTGAKDEVTVRLALSAESVVNFQRYLHLRLRLSGATKLDAAPRNSASGLIHMAISQASCVIVVFPSNPL
jgi:hypothetical protein